MPKMEIVRSIEIAAPPEKVFAVVSDLGKWRPWNPWLVTDPSASVDISADGKHYSWRGKRTGSGEMRITAEQSPNSVDLDLTFLTPFKSRAKVGFRIAPTQSGSKVDWTLQSSLPFFMFFFTNVMKNMIAMDYERGLTMLKDYVETGTVPSKIVERGESNYPGCKYVGISTECAFSELGSKMTEDFDKLQKWRESAGIESTADAFCTYRKWNMSKGRVTYTCGLPVQTLPEDLPAPLEAGEIPPLKTFVLEHIGPYRHLGNAWSTGMQMGRGKEFRTSKAYTPFEVYQMTADGRLPGPDSDEQTRTAIHFAVR